MGRRNPGIALDLDWVRDLRLDRAEIEERTASIAAGPEPAGHNRVDALLRAVACIDLTTLSGDDTPDRVRALCATALRPIPPALMAAARRRATAGPAAGDGLTDGAARGGTDAPVRVASVCVFPSFIPIALEALRGSDVPVAAVAAAFPHGQSPLPLRIAEVRAAVEAGAREIDAVIRRTHVLLEDWSALYDEVLAIRAAAGDARLKMILATGELRGPDDVIRASTICLMAGADFIKTSTGKESVNATLEAGAAMARAIRIYEAQTGHTAGLKPAGGIRTPAQAFAWQRLVREELGEEALGPDRFRIGASGLLGAIVSELEAALETGSASTDRST